MNSFQKKTNKRLNLIEKNEKIGSDWQRCSIGSVDKNSKVNRENLKKRLSVENQCVVGSKNVLNSENKSYVEALRLLLVKRYDIKMVKLPGGSSCRSSFIQLTNNKKKEKIKRSVV